jgi:hypothetical protein
MVLVNRMVLYAVEVRFLMTPKCSKALATPTSFGEKPMAKAALLRSGAAVGAGMVGVGSARLPAALVVVIQTVEVATPFLLCSVIVVYERSVVT